MESNEIAIEVKNVTKTFKVYNEKSGLKDNVFFWRKYSTRTVLDNISFSIKKGEAVGLIGKNGCGKSTTLKMLTRILYPNAGTVKLNGRVSSLIELGAGFHPDMSGRENIYINASIFGLTKAEIDERIDDIIEFSELGSYIDNPVRTYSSGMYMRLAFSVAINVDADILLIDEILAVGDANFQAKCFNKLREIKERGTTIVIVSHSLSQIEFICDRSIWIKEGKIEMSGHPKDVHIEYLNYMNQEKAEQTQKAIDEYGISSRGVHSGDARAVFSETRLIDSEGIERYTYSTGESITLDLDFTVRERVDDAVLGFAIFRSDGLWVFGTNTRIDRFDNFYLDKDGNYKVKFDSVNLLAGEYWVDVTIEYSEGVPVDYFRHAIEFNIVSNVNDAGVVRFEHEWELNI